MRHRGTVTPALFGVALLLAGASHADAGPREGGFVGSASCAACHREAVLKAQTYFAGKRRDRYLLDIYNLIGDPATVMK